MAVADADAKGALWDEELRQEATSTLLPVFFPIEKPITAETALKRVLRRKYQRQRFQPNQKSRGKVSRGRLAALVLGTSVMRLRHWHAVASGSDTKIPIPYPLGNDCVAHGRADDVGSSLSEEGSHSTEERSLVRAMVDEHARYLLTPNDVHPTIQHTSQFDNPAISLSIQYSLPSFLTAALLDHYGYNQTIQICSLMNDPGPIMLRKNAVRFSGSDEDLCKLLWEEDGICAEPLTSLLRDGNRLEDRRPAITSPPDGNNRYTMRSLPIPGSAMPPEGALRLIPPNTNATTSVEQRRRQKSIWSMNGWLNGHFEVQDAGSQLIVQSVEVSPGESVLDYCAGNGGKTFALASAMVGAAAESSDPMESKSHIVAHDVVEDRLRQIRGSLSRVGFVAEDVQATYNDTIYTCQGGKNCTIRIATTSDLECVGTSSASSFDAVLVDAPCSSSGVLRRRPSQRWDLTEEHVFKDLPNLQLEILEKAVSFVNENEGRLVYSTCSLLREENEDIVTKFEESDAFRDGGYVPWNFAPIGAIGENNHFLTLLPSESSDGFFIARWKRHKQRRTN